MNSRIIFARQAVAVVLVGGLFVGSAWAEKPDWAGAGGKGGADKSIKKQEDAEPGRRDGVKPGKARQGMDEARFGDRERRVIAEYYGAQFRAGKCPPGLAKKNNGCLPPGQAKKWSVGQPLPADLRRYALPNELLLRLPLPPAGHEYVRVASDILLVAVGTQMIVDAIEHLGF